MEKKVTILARVVSVVDAFQTKKGKRLCGGGRFRYHRAHCVCLDEPGLARALPEERSFHFSVGKI
jgi:hypothetical protein